jgi:hypothetical protein
MRAFLASSPVQRLISSRFPVRRYYSEVEAARAFDRAALCIYGELAITNFGLAVARQDSTPVSAHILMVKQEYDRFRKQQQEEQQMAELNAANLSIAAANPALQQFLQPQEIAAGSPHGSSASAGPLPTSIALDLATSAFSEPLPDLSLLPGAAPALASDLLVLSNMDSGSSLPVTSSAAAGPVSTDWLLGQLANLGIAQRNGMATGDASAVPVSGPLAGTFSHPVCKQQSVSDGFTSLAQQVQLGPRLDGEAQSSSLLASGWPAGAAGQPQQLVAPGVSASGLTMWAQQGGLVSPHTPFGNLMLQAQGPPVAPTAALNETSKNQQATLVGTGGGMGALSTGAAQVTQGLNLNGMLQAMQEEARLEGLIRQQQEQLAQLEQLREHQRALIMQQYRQ